MKDRMGNALVEAGSQGSTGTVLQDNRRMIVEPRRREGQTDPIHEAQLLTYLKLGRFRTGLLLNFQTAVLKDGIKRMVL